jgi:hypothetical protein
MSRAAASSRPIPRLTIREVASRHWDLVCVGGGMAGLVASNRARQLGMSAVILEAGSDEIYRCNTRMSGGALHCCMADITDPEPLVLERIMRDTAGAARPDLAAAMARDGRRAVQWLRAEGAQFIKVALTGQNHVLAAAAPGAAGLELGGPRTRRAGAHARRQSRAPRGIPGARCARDRADHGRWPLCRCRRAVGRRFVSRRGPPPSWSPTAVTRRAPS